MCCGKARRGRRFHSDGVLDGQAKKRRTVTADKVKVWFDAEGDFLEVRFTDHVGYMKETDNEAVMERLDERGRVIGFSIMQVSRLAKQKPLVANLLPTVS
ncbi:MAG: DUF2283 domain-containing protein [Verrucomicrobia bacterium]|nr:DUF2283 domain-containing protein [Verrucomicrobiota bacterium]MBT4226649.1 DUF2283 domain-containing protein [Verrucomicrobiota bacterium]